MKHFRVALIAAAATLIGATPAWAYGAWNFNGCGGSKFATCASVSITSAAGSQTGRTKITIVVTNNSGMNGTFAGTQFTQIGLYGLPGGTNYVSNSLTVNGASSSVWQLGSAGLSGEGIASIVRGVDTQSGMTGALAAGQTLTFEFEITGPADTYAYDDFAIHGQGGPNGCSTKLVVSGGSQNTGELATGQYDPACVPTTVTPEPASLVLLGTGLVGLGGLAKRRRKK